MNPPSLPVVLALAAVACQRGGVSTSIESSIETTTTATVASTMPTSNAVGSVEAAAPIPAPADECTPGERITPATLAGSWPARIGARVRFTGHVEIALDEMDVVVTAGGHRFVVVAGPDQLWQGDKERTFTVMGAKTVSLGGRTTLPQLLLEPECSP